MRKIVLGLLGCFFFFGLSFTAEPIGKAIFSDLLSANRTGTTEDLKWKYQTLGPVAVVLYCSDPSEDPSALFSQDKDQLVIVRIAGNMISIAGTFADSVEIGSIEYAVHYQGVPLVVVMGHSNCSVVGNVLDLAASDTNAPAGNMNSVFQVIRPAVTLAMIFGDHRDRELRLAIDENVRNMVLRLKRSRYMLGKLVDAGKLTIVGCVYNLDNGLVEVINTR
ncbi:MAG: hypothetical protein HZA94_03755 [Candidatus Vogelbacteria bacterium]|nr:hypothetical protein [Candidatus Vogelbacteria bacterium]